jgi:hypothetical protein
MCVKRTHFLRFTYIIPQVFILERGLVRSTHTKTVPKEKTRVLIQSFTFLIQLETTAINERHTMLDTVEVSQNCRDPLSRFQEVVTIKAFSSETGSTKKRVAEVKASQRKARMNSPTSSSE